MERQSLGFCRRLARAMYIVIHFGEWLIPASQEIQRRLINIRQELEASIEILEKEARKFQLSLTRTKLSTCDFKGTSFTWYTFQLSMPFDYEVGELLARVKNFAGILTLPQSFRLGFELGFIGKHVTYRTSGKKWKLHVSGATHLARGGEHIIFFDTEFLEKAHDHKVGFTLGHELLHSVLNVDDKGLTNMGHEFYQGNMKLLEEEGLRLRQEAFPFFKILHRNVANLINTSIVQEQIRLLDGIIMKSYSELHFPFPSNFQMRGTVKCPLCSVPMEFIMS